MKNNKAFSTKVIASGFTTPDCYNAINMPVYRTSAFEFQSAEAMANTFQNKETGHTYSRVSNPTVENFEQKIKLSTNAENVIALTSGMAAISNAFMAIAYAGSNIVTSPHLFGNTFSFFKYTLAEFGVETRFVDINNIAEVEAAIDENTCALFCELITNPHLEIADIEEISKITRLKRIPLIVDTTIIPWCGFDARRFGVDIEVVSTTKYISAGASSVGGVILDFGTFDWSANKKLSKTPATEGLSAFSFKLKREIVRNIGAYMTADTASVQTLGLESLQLRFEKMSQSAYELAVFLSEQDNVTEVNYPQLKTSRYYHTANKLFGTNMGAMLTFNLKSKRHCFEFINKLRVIRRATNLFDNKSLVIHPESTIYGTFSPEMKQFMDIDDTLIRLSVGLEDTGDLKADIINALDIL